MGFHALISLAAMILEGAGVLVIVAGALVAAARFAIPGGARDWKDAYRAFRQNLGRAILLGLELLVGADIIRTVAEVPTLRSVAVLAGIVLIRTFLSFALEVELEGRWPWQAAKESKG